MPTDYDRRREEEDDDRAEESRRVNAEHAERQRLYGSTTDEWGDAAPDTAPTRQPDRLSVTTPSSPVPEPVKPGKSQEQQRARPTPEPDDERAEAEKDDSPTPTGIDGQPLTTAETEAAEFDSRIQNEELNRILAEVDDRGRLESPDWRELQLDTEAGIDDRYIQNAQILTYFQTGQLVHLTDPGQAFVQFGRLADDTDVRYQPDLDTYKDIFYHGALADPDDKEKKRPGGLDDFGIDSEDLMIDNAVIWDAIQNEAKYGNINRTQFRQLIEQDIGRPLTDAEWHGSINPANEWWSDQLANERTYRRALVQTMGAQERAEDVLRNSLETGYGDRFLIITNAKGERFLVRAPGDFNTLGEGDRFQALRIPKDRLLDRSDILDVATPNRQVAQGGLGIIAGHRGRHLIPELGGYVDVQPYGGNLPEHQLWPSIVKTSTFQGTLWDQGDWVIGDREGVEAAEEARKRGDPVKKHGWHISIPMPLGRPTNTAVSSAINIVSLVGVGTTAGKITYQGIRSAGTARGLRSGGWYTGKQAAEEFSQELAQEGGSIIADSVYVANPNLGTALGVGVDIWDLEPPLKDWAASGGRGIRNLGGSLTNTFREFYAQDGAYQPFDPDAGRTGDAGATEDFSEATDGAWAAPQTNAAATMTERQRALLSGATAGSTTEAWTPESVSEATGGAWALKRDTSGMQPEMTSAQRALLSGAGASSTTEAWAPEDLSGTADGPDIVVNPGTATTTATTQQVDTAVPWESALAEQSRAVDRAHALEQALQGSSRDAWGSMAPVETQTQNQQEQLAEQQRQEQLADQQRQEQLAEQQRQEQLAEQQRQEQLAEQQRQEQLTDQQRQEIIEQQGHPWRDPNRLPVTERFPETIIEDPDPDTPIVEDPDPPVDPPFVEDPDPPVDPPFVADPDPPYKPPVVEDPDVIYNPPPKKRVVTPVRGRTRVRGRFVLPPIGGVGSVDPLTDDEPEGDHAGKIAVDDGQLMVVADLNTGKVSQPVASPTGTPGTRVLQRQRRRPRHDVGNVRRYITKSLGMTPEQFNGSRRYSGRAGRRRV